jgi:DNA-binding NarL/FixJ family response regulator
MNATIRLAAPLADTLPSHEGPGSAGGSSEDCIMTSELVDRLVDALMAAFALSEWEEQVVHHMLFGRSCHAIGRKLGIRETTVHKHIHRVFGKTHTQDRRGLYDLALRLAAVQAIHAVAPISTRWAA